MKMSVLVIFLALSPSAFSQVEQGSYQCTNGGTLNGGFLLYSNGSFEAVAKHKDGIIYEVSGIVGRRQAAGMEGNQLGQGIVGNFTYADLAKVSKAIYDYSTTTQNGFSGGGMGGGFVGTNPQANAQPFGQPIMQEEAPDRDDIESAEPSWRPSTSPKQRESSDKRPGDNPGPRPGDLAPPKAGDRAPVLRAGDQNLFRNNAPLRTGDQVIRPGVITYSALLDLQGNISQVSYRNGKTRPVVVQIDSTNRTSTDSVYGQVKGQLVNMKTFAKCCTNSPGPGCRMNYLRQAQETQRSVKPTSDQNTQTNGPTLVLPFGQAPSDGRAF